MTVGEKICIYLSFIIDGNNFRDFPTGIKHEMFCAHRACFHLKQVEF